MNKIITCYREKNLYIIRFLIEEVNTNLRFIYEIYNIKNKSKYKFIEDTFKSNPESSVFNDIYGDIEKVFIHSISQIEAGEELSKFNVDYNNLHNMGVLRLPRITLNIENYKLSVVYNILKFYFENYDLIKLKMDSATPKENKENHTNLINRKIEINDIIKLTNNNLIIYYLHSYLNHFSYHNEHNKFELSNRTLKIHINNLVFDNNTVDSKNIYLLIYNLDIPDSEINNTLQILFKTLIKVINNELLISADNNIEEELILKLNVLNFLCIIYGIKYLYGNKISYEKIKYLPILNHIYFQLIKNFKNLEFDRIEFYESLNNSEGEVTNFINLNEISKKYKYLTQLSTDEFIKAILTDIKNSPPQDNNSNNPIHSLILNNPKILNIDYLLTLDNKDNNSLISYKKINTPDFIKLDKKFVITEEYLQILYLINSNGFIDHTKLDFRIVKFSDLIINEIIPAIEKYHEMLISTLIIMNNIINVILKDKIMVDNSSKLFLIYKIIIPHLYNKYNINKFIDYFL